MSEQIILGIIQGVVEWLPISSEGVIVLAMRNFFNSEIDIETIIKYALFLHLGTFLAALIYFRKDVFSLCKAMFNYGSTDLSTQRILKFLITATLISGVFGFILLKIFSGIEERLFLSGRIIILIIGLMLLITAGMQIKAKQVRYKKAGDLSVKHGFLLGIVQGLAVLPGLSRSGLTVSVLLLKKIDDADALRISFLMSLPIVLVGNIIFNLRDFVFSEEALYGLLFSFIFGLLTIGLLLKLAKRINFGYFVLIFGILVVVSVFV
ncbi:MAG: undecaprenyl-diphosphate phosphatase [bacterium]